MRILIEATKQVQLDDVKRPKSLNGLEAIILDGKVTIPALVAGNIYKGTFADGDLHAFATVIRDNMKFELGL